MLKKYAKIVGIVLVIVGILGFIPGINMKGHLLGIFHVNAAHNIVHIVSGLIAFWTSRTSMRASRLFFQIFGVVYFLVALLGFGYGNREILGLIANNCADSWLHLAFGLIFGYLGFLYKGK
jgi:hypothetical protein